MSKYCGKCDVWDTLIMIHELNDTDTDWSKIKVTQYTKDSDFDWDKKERVNVKEINFNSVKDVLKYAPYLIASGSFNKGKIDIFITEKSYLDELEDRYGIDTSNYRKEWFKDMLAYGYTANEAHNWVYK